MCQNGKNLGFCCGFCEISAAGADLLIRNGTLLRVGAEGFGGKAEIVWIWVEMWERGLTASIGTNPPNMLQIALDEYWALKATAEPRSLARKVAHPTARRAARRPNPNLGAEQKQRYPYTARRTES